MSSEHDGGAVDAGLPAIPVSAGALIWDQAGRLLILKPTYKSGWTIPGGVMEADGETPWDACRREVREEWGLELGGGRLACVDFRPGHPGRRVCFSILISNTDDRLRSRSLAGNCSRLRASSG